MNNIRVRKFWAGFLIGISAILFILSLIGMGALWFYNEPLTRESTSRLQAIDLELTQAQEALQGAKTELERTLRIVESAEETMSKIKDELTQAKELFGDVNGTLDQQLLPSLKSSREKIDQAKSTLQDLRDALAQLNSLPFMSLNLPGDELLKNLIDAANSIDADISKVEQLVIRASTFTQDISYLMGGDLTQTKQSLENFLVVVGEYDEKITGWRGQVKFLLENLPRWIDSAAIILTIFLLWFGFSQFSLFLHGLGLWRGDDPLTPLRETWHATRMKSQPAPDIEI